MFQQSLRNHSTLTHSFTIESWRRFTTATYFTYSSSPQAFNYLLCYFTNIPLSPSSHLTFTASPISHSLPPPPPPSLHAQPSPSLLSFFLPAYKHWPSLHLHPQNCSFPQCISFFSQIISPSVSSLLSLLHSFSTINLLSSLTHYYSSFLLFLLPQPFKFSTSRLTLLLKPYFPIRSSSPFSFTSASPFLNPLFYLLPTQPYPILPIHYRLSLLPPSSLPSLSHASSSTTTFSEVYVLAASMMFIHTERNGANVKGVGCKWRVWGGLCEGCVICMSVNMVHKIHSVLQLLWTLR